jgi:uridine kinase
MRIGISGPSGCGKSTVSKMLASKHSMHHLCLDDYWIDNPDCKFRMETLTETYRIFEFAPEYNGGKLAQDALKYPSVVMEGFCLMAFPQIRQIVDWHFYIDIPWEYSMMRRCARDGNSKSTRGWIALGPHKNDLLTSFQRDLVRTTVLDGKKSTEVLVEEISNKLLALSND